MDAVDGADFSGQAHAAATFMPSTESTTSLTQRKKKAPSVSRRGLGFKNS